MKRILLILFTITAISCSKDDDCSDRMEANERLYQQVLDNPNSTDQQIKEAKEEYELRKAEGC